MSSKRRWIYASRRDVSSWKSSIVSSCVVGNLFLTSDGETFCLNYRLVPNLMQIIWQELTLAVDTVRAQLLEPRCLLYWLNVLKVRCSEGQYPGFFLAHYTFCLSLNGFRKKKTKVLEQMLPCIYAVPTFSNFLRNRFTCVTGTPSWTRNIGSIVRYRSIKSDGYYLIIL